MTSLNKCNTISSITCQTQVCVTFNLFFFGGGGGAGERKVKLHNASLTLQITAHNYQTSLKQKIQSHSQNMHTSM